MIRYGPRPIDRTPPNGALFVDWDHGDDGNTGTDDRHPLKTPHEAARRAADQATIVLRGSDYPTEWGLPWNKALTVQAYPGDYPTFTGSDPVNVGWVRVAAGLYRLDGHGQVFDRNVGDWPIVDPNRPWAPYPLQVRADGDPLERVGSIAEVEGRARFMHDENNQQLWIGVNPGDHAIEITYRQRAIIASNARTELHGLTVRNYATSPRQIAAVTGGGPGSLFSDLSIAGCSAAGLFVNTTDDITVRHCLLANNGQFGGRAWRSRRLVLENCYIAGNNWMEFVTGQAAGGWKSDTECHLSTVRFNRWLGNVGHACWWDIQSNDLEVHHNDFGPHPRGVAVFFEISRRALICGNRMRGCVRAVYVAGSTDAEIWNNTEIDCTEHTACVTDNRSMSLYGYEHRNYRIRNGNVTQGIEDQAVTMRMWHDGHSQNRRGYAEVNWSSDHNRFHRRNDRCGQLASITMGLGVRRHFNRIVDLVQQTGQEVHSDAVTAATNPFMDADGRAVGNAVGRGAEPPPRVRELLEIPSGPVDIGWYGPVPTPPQEPPMPYDVTPFQTEFDALVAELRRLEDIIANDPDAATIAALQQQLHSVSVAYWNTAVLLNTANATIATLTAALAEAQTQIGLLEDLVGTHEDTIATQASTIAVQETTISALGEQVDDLTAELAECEQNCPPPPDEPRLIVGGSNKHGYPDLKARLGLAPGAYTHFVPGPRFSAGDLDTMEVYVADGVIPSISVHPGTEADTDFNMDQLAARGLDVFYGGYSVGNEPTMKALPAEEWRAANIYAASQLPETWQLVAGPFQRMDILAAPTDPRYVGNWIGEDTSWVDRLGVNVYDKNHSVGRTFEWLVTITEPQSVHSVEQYAQQLGVKMWIREYGAAEAPPVGGWNRPPGWKPDHYRAMYAYCSARLDQYEVADIYNSDFGGDPPPEGWWAWTTPEAMAAYVEIVTASKS